MTSAVPPEAALDRLSRGLYRHADRDSIPIALPAKVVAGALGISVEGLYDMVRTGTAPLEALRIGGRLLRFRRDDLLALLAA